MSKMDHLISSSGLRGIAMEEVTPDLFFKCGLASSLMKPGTYAVAYDVRSTSPLLADAFRCGLNAGGSHTVSYGLMPTPALAFLSRGLAGGVMITASHNPPQYNGAKIFDGRGASWKPSDYRSLVNCLRGNMACSRWDSVGSSRHGAGLHRYLEWLSSRREFRDVWRVGLDPGNGSTCLTAPLAFESAGCDLEVVNSHPDPLFKGRGSEPNESSLSSLSELVKSKGLDVGFAYDGDGDRFAVVDEHGRFLKQDLALAFVASEMVKGGKKDIVVNVDTSSVVDFMVEAAGGRIHRAPVGDVYVLEALIDLGGSFGGETCGAWIFPEESLCPDGVLSSIIFLSMLEESHLRPSEVCEGVPAFHTERRSVPCQSIKKEALMRAVSSRALGWLSGVELDEVDGVRVSLADRSWVLIRPSGTEPLVRVTSESQERSVAKELADRAVALVKAAMGDLE
ncbi:MAG: hypothetical protein ACO0C9_02975 [Candidatus Methanosuratincola verstraetei]|jgi:phosphoglucosamine mutase|uniref:Phosphoglucosamine mutase n=1 Tax=Methanosuratincola subterraneus TaxID=2593994 RepID=A0A3S3VFR9_METS7|nr:MAG: Phosphoglucosamine mutase [Candidatus Methanosuratincola subterraneus]